MQLNYKCITLYKPLNPESLTWQGSYSERSEKFWKNAIFFFTISRAKIFCVKQFGGTRICRVALDNTLYQLKAKSKIRYGRF